MSSGTDPVTAQFSLQADAIRYLGEAEFGEDLAAARTKAATTVAPFGQLILAGAGQPPIGLYDDLLPLADGLGSILPALRAGQPTVLGAFSQPDSLRFTPDGDLLVVTDRKGDARHYPAAALTAALVECHGRLVGVLCRLEPKDADWQAKLADIAA